MSKKIICQVKSFYICTLDVVIKNKIRKHHTMKKITIALIFVLFGSLYLGLVGQSKKSEQLKKDKQRVQAEINKKQKLLEETQKNKKASQQQLGILRDQIATREIYMTELQGEIDVLADERRQNEAESSRLQRKLICLKEDYSRVVYETFKNRRQSDPLLFVLSSENYSDMFRRMHFYSQYAQNVQKHVDAITTTQSDIARKCEEIALIEEEKLGVMHEQEAVNAQQQQQRRDAERLSKSLQKKESALRAEIDKKKKEQARLDAAIKQAIDAEIAAAAARNNKGKSSGKSGSTSGKGSSSSSSSNTIALTPAQQQLSSTFANNRGRLPWPVSACSKIQDYGSHPHPDVPSVNVMNIGITLLTHANAEVKSVFKGTVLSIRDFEDAKFVIVQHGEYLTIYKHITNIAVKAGQEIATGQKIGTVAKEPSSGTYEFTFIMSKGKTYLNPNEWLQRL